MESEALDGWWWLPDRHDQARFGRLFASQSGRWKLDIYGGLEDDSAEAGVFGTTNQMATASLIHGHLLQGAPGPRFTTLINCRQQAAN
jgi:hypothetical protein